MDTSGFPNGEGGIIHTRLPGAAGTESPALSGDLGEEITGMGSGDSTHVCNENTILQEDKDLQGAQFWTPKGFVNIFEDWKTSMNKYDKTSAYPAYVPSIVSSQYGTILNEHGFIFGSNEKHTNDDCGKLYRKIQCSQNPLHGPAYRHLRCNDPGCPVCYVKYASKMADRVTERVQGYKSVFPGTRLYHLIFWSDRADRPYADLRAAFMEAKRLLQLMGAKSAVVWYHPYRIKEELKHILRLYRTRNGLNGRAGFWKLAHDDVLNLGGVEKYLVYGPHWHAEATGFLRNFKFLFEKYGIGYKKRRYIRTEAQVHEVAHYVSTHACREAGKSSVRYFGDISYRVLQREHVETKIKDVVCAQCGAALEEYDCDDTGMTLQKVKDKITEKIKYYLYWKKGQPKPAWAGPGQCLITRFTRDAYL